MGQLLFLKKMSQAFQAPVSISIFSNKFFSMTYNWTWRLGKFWSLKLEFLHIYGLDFGKNQREKLTSEKLTPKIQLQKFLLEQFN